MSKMSVEEKKRYRLEEVDECESHGAGLAIFFPDGTYSFGKESAVREMNRLADAEGKEVQR